MNNKLNGRKTVCIIGFIAPANIKPLMDLTKIVKHFNELSLLIVHNELVETEVFNMYENVYKILYKQYPGIFARIMNFIRMQLKISYILFNLRKTHNTWIFYIGDFFVLPMILSKILRKKTLMLLGGSLEKEIDLESDKLTQLLAQLKKINLKLSTSIIIYSENLIREWNLENYKTKIIVAHRHFLNLNIFRNIVEYNDRELLIGYIGRFNVEKGIINFVESIPKILENENDLKFLIVGSGKLESKIINNITKNNLNNKVEIVNWIKHDELPVFFNKLKLLVLPSYTEGLPNVMIESMACGTPVLAMGVGAIPDIIKDGENGFLMEDNSPECIAENIKRVLHYELDNISINGMEFVKSNYNFKNVLELWESIIK